MIAESGIRSGSARGAVLAILCVDDDEHVLMALRRTLEEHRVLTARNGSEAIELLQKHAVGVVISDYHMPGLDGVAFLSVARKLQPQTIGIILSGSIHASSVIEAVVDADLAYAYLEKPWRDGELRLLVRCALEARAARAERLRLRGVLDELQVAVDELELLLESLPEGQLKAEARRILARARMAGAG